MLGQVPGVTEGLDDLQPLGVLPTLGGRRGLLHLGAQLIGQRHNIKRRELVADHFAAHAYLEGPIPEGLNHLLVVLFSQDDPRIQGCLAWIGDDVRLAVQHLLEVF